jgi:triphosphoribosyl-dephospho-CoA synthase
MSSTASPDRAGALRSAYLAACALELRALKPGNVHDFAGGHGMTVADFEASARASAGPLCAPGRPVGQRIYDAILATRAAVGCNTNLGIVLLAAPLLAAAEIATTPALRPALGAVLRRLSVDDAVAAYEAIRLAAPAGLGRSAEQDVAEAPTVDLRQAMTIAAPRDRIAHQYASDYADIFDLGVPRCAAAERAGERPEWLATLVYLDFLAAFPDSHIMRKYGASTAMAVRDKARDVATLLDPSNEREQVTGALLAFDRWLKERRLNPGTCADLTVATLLAHAATSILANGRPV